MEIDVDKAIRELKEHASAMKELLAGLQFIKKYGGTEIAIPELQSLFNGSVKNITSDTGNDTLNTNLMPDTFYGMSINDAAEKYLRMVGHVCSFNQLYSALTQGGFESSESKEKLSMSLTRATMRFKKFGSGMDASYGLLEWYPSSVKAKRGNLSKGEDKVEESLGDAEDSSKEEIIQTEQSVATDALRTKTE